MQTCHCGAKSSFDACCKPYLSGAKRAPSAEALMRARYSAFVVGDIAFIRETYDPKRASDFDEAGTREWSEKSEWQGLEILKVEEGEGDARTGCVEFKARFKVKGEEQEHHERARFRKDEKTGAWYFVDGETPGLRPVRREEPKIGRNDPCPCGSGKKHKKCCAA